MIKAIKYVQWFIMHKVPPNNYFTFPFYSCTGYIPCVEFIERPIIWLAEW